jgi:ATP-dependent Clp protease ATP-binding subunit ClpA
MYERFTDRARAIMQLANQEAQSLNHQYIGTEHILLGLIKEGSGVAVNVLNNLGVDLIKLRSEVLSMIQSGPFPVSLNERLPQLPRAARVIAYAMEEVRMLKHSHVGTEHILLGLLRAEEGVASQALIGQGLQLEQVREGIVHLLGAGVRSTPPPPRPRADIEDLPDEVEANAAELDAEIRRLTAAKEEAVANQEFEQAASLRDQVHELHRKKSAMFHEWIVNRPIESSWLSANDGAVLTLARTISEQRRWDLLPNLADSLEQAGCRDAILLDHCRQPGGHYARCWVVDLLLAKP